MKKFLFDLFPVILFFVIFKWGQGNPAAAQDLLTQYLSGFMAGGALQESHAPILLATAVAILASFGQIGYMLVRRKKIDAMLWISLAIITVFGGATIYFNNPTFIKWKPTILYWCFGAGLLIGQFAFRKNLIRSMLGAQISLPEPVWFRLNLSWAAFFVVMGIINLCVAFAFGLSEAAWVNFKLFGFTALMVIFAVGQSLFLSKYIKETP
ncbi:MAG TPA: septation protein A [Oxalobacteraceae bacterium]|nr:septation protein A [Oxalobacteraceae bacterium]